tara:strand:+ start:92 stop:574 length:483 start_codon:yes stop_codon:yes gene_type:complete
MALATLETVYSTANGLRIRAAPTTGPLGKVVGKLNRGDAVKIVWGGAKDVDPGGDQLWEIASPWVQEKGDEEVPWSKNTGTTWVYVSQPKKGWTAMKHGGKTYLQKTPPKAGTPAEKAPIITPQDIVPPTKAGGGGMMVVLLVAAGGLAAWWWTEKRGKK